ncbi:hypothetical protein GCM10010912_68210 [Paenibacillus albidus]|uniref:Tetratricopeptide repeat protein n=1 Tax=Paenibacillus albidus TaxID=2041023 RepID=A0A917LCU3_9BACL|nr:hypothetical protein [Paenibacillus albidus]GGG14136.1 hypothetical protein GCM10010912_68210 [Paenibacillus albidus]
MNLDFEELMEEAYDLPRGKAQIAVLEQAIRAADTAGDLEAGFEARSELVESAIFSGYPMKAIVAFSWQLGQYDKNNDLFDNYQLLWSYKWILDKVACFPDIPREQIDNLLDDMKKRYAELGYSERTYCFYKAVLLMQYGELEEAGRYLDQFQSLDRDEMSDCEACEQNRLIDYEVLLGRDERTLRVAEPILSGQMSCGEVPHVTLSTVLMPLYRLGRQEEADKLQRKSYRLVKGNNDFLLQIGENIRYLALTDPFRGLELFEKHLSQALDHENPWDQMMFSAYASTLFSRLKQETVAFQVKLPASFPHPEFASDVVRLEQHFLQEALATADRLDRRNGNSYYGSLIQSL